MSAEAETLAERLAGKRIAIVGDLVADQFLSGTISRVSREAPVFILRHDETETRPGGAANAAVNVAMLGGVPLLIGCVGDDESGLLLRQSLSAFSVGVAHIETLPSARTTRKVRVLAGQHYAPRQQVIRIDYESHVPEPEELEPLLSAHIDDACGTADAIVVSDYGYGVVTSGTFERARKAAAEAGVPLILDSRFRLGEFHGATSATPNQEEVEQLLGPDFTDADCVRLLDRLGLETLLVTRGNAGMTVVSRGSVPRHIDAVGSRSPVDVTGAGDTVIAAYSLSLAAGFDHFTAAEIANHAGSIVVMKKGTAAASIDELTDSFRETNRLLGDTAAPARQ